MVYAYSPVSMRFIMKRSMLWICPPIFVMVWLIGCITIDRQNRDKSIQALQTGSNKIKKSGRAVRYAFPFPSMERERINPPFIVISVVYCFR